MLAQPNIQKQLPNWQTWTRHITMQSKNRRWLFFVVSLVVLNQAQVHNWRQESCQWAAGYSPHTHGSLDCDHGDQTLGIIITMIHQHVNLRHAPVNSTEHRNIACTKMHSALLQIRTGLAYWGSVNSVGLCFDGLSQMAQWQDNQRRKDTQPPNRHWADQSGFVHAHL